MSDRRSPELRRTAVRRNARADGGATFRTVVTASALRIVVAGMLS